MLSYLLTHCGSGCLPCLQWIWPYLLYLFEKFRNLMNELKRFCRRDPPHPEAVRMDPCKLQQLLQERQPFLSHDITRLVMTFADPSAGDEDTVGPGLKRFQHIMGRDRTGAHDPNGPDRCGILKSTDPSQVSCGVSSPRAQESNDLGLKFVRHSLLPNVKCQSSTFK